MPLVKRLRRRNTNIVVEANGEVLFMPNGDVGRWNRTFSNRARVFAAQEAPSNKRPRWAHYGKPLKTTMRAATSTDPKRMQVHSAVGSTSAHAVFVDQGTGVYNESGPYKAKVLPPWTRGGPSLYEHTWRPAGGSGKPVREVMIKGQKGQFFLDAGVRNAFTSMRMQTLLVPGTGGGQVSEALGSFPDRLANFIGATPPTAAFRAQLEEWRAWRDEAWNRNRGLGRNPRGGSRRSGSGRTPRASRASRYPRVAKNDAQKRAAAAERSRKYRERQRRDKNKPGATASGSRSAERARFLAAMQKKYGSSNVEGQSLEYRDGYWYVTVRTTDDSGRTIFKEVRGRSTA